MLQKITNQIGLTYFHSINIIPIIKFSKLKGQLKYLSVIIINKQFLSFILLPKWAHILQLSQRFYERQKFLQKI